MRILNVRMHQTTIKLALVKKIRDLSDQQPYQSITTCEDIRIPNVVSRGIIFKRISNLKGLKICPQNYLKLNQIILLS